MSTFFFLLLGYDEKDAVACPMEINKPLFDDPAEEIDCKINYWGQWGKDIFDKVSPFFEEEGSDINAYYLQNVDVNKQLLKDLQLIPIWGNILSSRFTFGRNPASSACVEGEINKIKLRMKKYSYPIRVEKYVDDSLEYLNGRIKIVNSDLDENKRNDDFICEICQAPMTINNASSCSICITLVHKSSCSEINQAQNVCLRCAKSDHAKKNVALNEVEDWRGKGNPRPKKQPQTKNSQKNTRQDVIECIACRAGDFPGGAHKCISCNKSVHAFDGCSISISTEDEGYGEKRLCLACSSSVNSSTNDSAISDLDNLAANNDTNSISNNNHDNSNQTHISSPNRTSTTVETKRTTNTMRNKYRQPAKYLGDRIDDIKDSLAWGKNRPRPVIKNGNDLSLAPLKIDKKTVTLKNTCAFDSILYLVILAVSDFAHLKYKVSYISL